MTLVVVFLNNIIQYYFRLHRNLFQVYLKTWNSLRLSFMY
jgi:hypothetical protein